MGVIDWLRKARSATGVHDDCSAVVVLEVAVGRDSTYVLEFAMCAVEQVVAPERLYKARFARQLIKQGHSLLDGARNLRGR